MAVLRAADIAFLDSAGPAGIDDDTFVFNSEVAEELTNAFSGVVVSDDADKADASAQGAKHRRHAAGAAQSLLPLISMEKDDGCFLADALGVAPDIAVEHQVAGHEHARLSQTLN